jgi:hypothetical protein
MNQIGISAPSTVVLPFRNVEKRDGHQGRLGSIYAVGDSVFGIGLLSYEQSVRDAIDRAGPTLAGRVRLSVLHERRYGAQF